jgi:hypothetical protein
VAELHKFPASFAHSGAEAAAILGHEKHACGLSHISLAFRCLYFSLFSENEFSAMTSFPHVLDAHVQSLIEVNEIPKR